VGFDWFAAAGERGQPGPAGGRVSSSNSTNGAREASHGGVWQVISQLIRTGSARHPVIGATLNEQYTGSWAQIAREAAHDPGVAPGGPAARAGLLPGDSARS
jgi:S1-C subfamily serine protease